jgi:hypothetical protein
MLNLSSLLEKFKHLKDPKEEREKIAVLLSKCLGFNIESNLLDIKKDILYLNVSGYVKTEVFMKKDLVLEALKKEGFRVEDIR